MESLCCLLPDKTCKLSLKGSPAVQNWSREKLLSQCESAQADATERHSLRAESSRSPGGGPSRRGVGPAASFCPGGSPSIWGSAGRLRPAWRVWAHVCLPPHLRSLRVRASHRPVVVGTPATVASGPAQLPRGLVLTRRLCDGPAPREFRSEVLGLGTSSRGFSWVTLQPVTPRSAFSLNKQTSCDN